MKIITAFLFCLLLASSISAQTDCIDSTLIDPSVPCPTIYLPVCGCNGITYNNACEAEVMGGVVEYTNGACAADVNCISTIQQEWGTLVDCSGEIDPVCGCDGVTYTNACMAFYYGGVTNYSIGPCGATEYCPVIPPFVDFGECDMYLGIANINGTCVPMSGCGSTGPNNYNYQAFFSQTMEECEQSCGPAPCIDSTLIDESIACTNIYLPVCGCNGITYSNSCEATNWYGVSSFTMGECTTSSVNDVALNEFNIFPIPTDGVVNISFTRTVTGTMDFLDIQGRRVGGLPVNGLTSTLYDLSALAPGIYIARFSAYNGTTLSRMIIRE